MNIQKLAEYNPWWIQGTIDERFVGKQRIGYDQVIQSLKIKEITIITGIRRSGKSTLMYQMIAALLQQKVNPKHILFLNLEDAKLGVESLDDLYAAYREEINPKDKAFVFLDEVHRKEGWERWLRNAYDKNMDCKFVISGSSSYLLKKEYSTLITGRNVSFEVFPLSLGEYLSFADVDYASAAKGLVTEKQLHLIQHALQEYLQYGGFPQVFFTDKDFKNKLLMQYFDDILYKDIIDRQAVNAQKARDLALYAITNITTTISLRNLRNTLGLSYDSIKDYISYYKDAFLLFTPDHFSYSFKEQKTIPSKIYCIDTGLRNAAGFTFSKDEGKLVENLVLVELKRRNKDIYYWTNEKHEVDFIIKNPDNTLIGINVSFTDTIDERETNGLLAVKKELKNMKKMILITKNTEKKEKNITFIPLWKWLLEK
ncbi:MAG: ATP-binding protein [Nanoarchaeota archaeon]